MVNSNKWMPLTLFALILLGRLTAFAQEAHATQIPQKNIGTVQSSGKYGDRIQINQWVDPTNGITDPLTQIVRVVGSTIGSGTATLLENCRVITALHVVLSISRGKDIGTLKDGEEGILGERFQYLTKPLSDFGGRRAKGSFTIIGHGRPKYNDSVLDAEEDWAIGLIDQEECERNNTMLNLGHVRIASIVDYLTLTGKSFLTAGYSYVEKAQVYGEDLYIDSKCGINEQYAQKSHSDAFFLANCSLWHGGSGQLLLAPAKINGKVQFYPNGRPKLVAYGIFQAPDYAYRDGTVIPYVDAAGGFAAFTNDLQIKMLPFLSGPVDLNLISKSKSSRPPIAAAAAFRN